MNKSQSLIQWYKTHKRDLPWRDTNDPYKIWLSEIILQQTRVDQGLNYFLRFVENFPTIHDLASADEETVLKLWQGLGYYSRARNLHFTAKKIVADYNGQFPEKYNEIIELKGIGEYTASAIASFCFNLPYPVLDGNVTRVIARLYNITRPVDNAAVKKELKQALLEIFDQEKPGLFNQAIMEFGALQCTPKNPGCMNCPLQHQCLAYSNNNVLQVPKKGKKIKIRHRYFNYLVIYFENGIYLSKRVQNDIWQNLYEFPLVETSKQNDLSEILQLQDFSEIVNPNNTEIIASSKIIKHLLSHQKLHIRFIQIKLKKPSKKLEKQYKKVHIDEIREFPVPIVVGNFIESNLVD